MTSKEFRKIASRFSKAELVEAVCGNISEWDLGLIALRLKQKKQNSIMHELEMAGNAVTDALNDYCEWVKNMADKYGDGSRFHFSDLPPDEQANGIAILTRKNGTEALENKLQRQFDRLLEV